MHHTGHVHSMVLCNPHFLKSSLRHTSVRGDIPWPTTYPVAAMKSADMCQMHTGWVVYVGLLHAKNVYTAHSYPNTQSPLQVPESGPIESSLNSSTVQQAAVQETPPSPAPPKRKQRRYYVRAAMTTTGRSMLAADGWWHAHEGEFD